MICYTDDLLLGKSNFNLNPLSLHDALKHHFISLKTDLIFLQPTVLEQKNSMKLVDQYMVIFFNF